MENGVFAGELFSSCSTFCCKGND